MGLFMSLEERALLVDLDHEAKEKQDTGLSGTPLVDNIAGKPINSVPSLEVNNTPVLDLEEVG